MTPTRNSSARRSRDDARILADLRGPPVPSSPVAAMTDAMGSTREPSDRRSTLGRVLESNERRLDELDRRGIAVTVDGPAVLEFLFDRALASATARELRLTWTLNVAGLLNQVETDAERTARRGIDLTVRRPASAHLEPVPTGARSQPEAVQNLAPTPMKVHMPRTHLGRRIGDWLGIAPDDSEAVARSPRGGLMREPPAAISASPAFEREIAELHRVIADLRSGLDQPLDT